MAAAMGHGFDEARTAPYVPASAADEPFADPAEIDRVADTLPVAPLDDPNSAKLEMPRLVRTIQAVLDTAPALRPNGNFATPNYSPQENNNPLAIVHPLVPDDFDSDAYLDANPDVMEAVAAGLFESAFDHYCKHGRQEKRPYLSGPRSAGAAYGHIETVNANIVSGWARTIPGGQVALFVDSVWLDTLEPAVQRPDLVDAAGPYGKGYKFFVGRYNLSSGTHIVEVRYLINGSFVAVLTGVGMADINFELQIAPERIFLSESSVTYFTKLFEDNTEIRRRLVADNVLKYRPSAWKGDIIFVDGAPQTPSSKYRVHNIIESLVNIGYDCCSLSEDELWRLEDGKYRASVVHFFRAPYFDAFTAAADAARANGARIGYDIDDLVFDQTLMPYMDGLRFLSPEELEEYKRGMSAYRDFIVEADYVTCTTDFLASCIEKLNKNVFVVPNSFAPFIARLSPEFGAEVRIGYYAGTKTHQAGFQVAATSLSRVLRRNPDVSLHIAGELDLAEFPCLNDVAEQVRQIPFMSYRDMLDHMRTMQIVIAPSEVGNPFCEAKSELKFFEATLCGGAVIASATDPFVKAIEDGESGFTARTPNDWEEKLQALISDPDRRSRMVENARRTVLARYSAEMAAARLLEASGIALERLSPNTAATPQIPQGRRATRRKRGPHCSKSVAFIVPELLIGSGGHRKIFRICYDLEQLGHEVTIYVPVRRTASENVEIIRRHYYPISGKVFRYNGTLGTHDTIVATAWDTAYLLRRHENCTDNPVYFVQDFEPMFMPVGSGYLRALATYKFGFRTVCLGQWVARRLNREFQLQPAVIPFPLDKSIYRHAGARYRAGKSVLLFAWPSQERRAFELATDALALVARQASGLHIGFYGEPDYPSRPFAYENHGLILSQEALANLYRNTTVGVCLSPTNPSLVGYEMIACGTALVDLDLPDATINFGQQDIPYLAQPTAEGIATEIMKALDDHRLREQRVARGIKFTEAMIDEHEMADHFVRYALSTPAETIRESTAA